MCPRKFEEYLGIRFPGADALVFCSFILLLKFYIVVYINM